MIPRSPGLLLSLLCLLLAGAGAAHAQVQPGRELVRLDPKNLVHEIAINANVATTITFPEKLSLLTGFGLVTDPAQALSMSATKVAAVHYENVIGDTLVVRLVKPGEPCHATVRTSRNIYLLRFTPAEEANLAVIVSPPLEKNAAAEIPPEKITDSRIKYDSEELVGMLSKARNRKALQSLNPGLYNGWQERNNLDMTTAQKDLVSTIYEIQRNPAKDLTIFRCWITNKGNEDYDFDPAGTHIRVGNRSYDAQLVDCAHTVPAGQRVAMDVILQGGPGGGREGLSIHQDFRVELPEPGRRNLLLPDPGFLGNIDPFIGGK
ncbi:MAG: hypothetical protein ACO1TE_12320 [Prosthecobacter sp.]